MQNGNSVLKPGMCPSQSLKKNKIRIWMEGNIYQIIPALMYFAISRSLNQNGLK
jgi:hypothetical protein